MRPLATLALTATLVFGLACEPAFAQMRRPGQDDGQQEDKDAAKRKKRDEEWNQPAAPLPALRNAGPCPYVKVLYDAGRYHEFKEGREASGQLLYSGEIQGISAGCQYKDDEPIRVRMQLLFALGKGPQATSAQKTYRYWVAVTDRNREIIAKEWFDLPVKFGGADRVSVREDIDGITIPRAAVTTSGSNFEVLVGFEVTPQMAAFNREGKRFRVNVGAPTAATSASQ